VTPAASGSRAAALALLLLLGLPACTVEVPSPTEPASATAVPSTPAAEPSPLPVPVVLPEEDAPAEPQPAPALLQQAAGGDGDSWQDTAGVEYRMGLVNAPEVGACGGDAATAYRRTALADGFTAEVYASDAYGRQVALVRTATGADLNVDMARRGLVDDRFLAEFRGENPSLAAELDAAFAAAKAERRGLWGGCAAPPPPPAAAPQPVVGTDCHPAYETCIPVKGDGSGAGAANDLDCGDIGRLVLLRQVGDDPYRLDGEDEDGRGCESYA
jgi:endonuclease YncB( thermonuclease family)